MRRKPKVFSFFDKGEIDAIGVRPEQYQRLLKRGKRRMRKLERLEARRQERHDRLEG